MLLEEIYGGGNMAKILIVEDEKAINDLVKFNLELVGHACSQVFDGEAGLTEALKLKYDLIILDVMLPKYSGFEIMEYIEGTPVIFVTAKSTPQDKIKGLRLGADDYITKPFNIVELVERGVLKGEEAEATVGRSLLPLLEAGADTIVLGCTHYPFLAETIAKVASEQFPERMTYIIDPAPAVAKHLVEIMNEGGLIRNSGFSIKLNSSGDGTALETLYKNLG